MPQDLKYAGENTSAVVGDHTTIRECCTINRGTTDRMTTKVGSHCLLMAYTHVAHDAMIGDHCVLANNANIAGHVTVEDWVIIEGVVAVQQFVRIGQHAFVAGGSLVRKNIPPFVKVAREPLSYIGVNAIGLRRRGFPDEFVRAVEDIYRTLYITGGNMSQALKVAELELPVSDAKETISRLHSRLGQGHCSRSFLMCALPLGINLEAGRQATRQTMGPAQSRLRRSPRQHSSHPRRQRQRKVQPLKAHVCF